jgi:AcrR family transcriptional regulator
VADTAAPGAGRVAQRRRTRKAIVEAAAALLAGGAAPSVHDIAKAADVSRRTVYLHFPTLDQLILDATLGAMNTDVDEVLARMASDDPRARLRGLVEALVEGMAESLPLGRRMIRLTVDSPPAEAGTPRRGYRRIGWIELALEPVRERLPRDQFDRLVSSLAMVIGWEGFIVLIDVRGLTPEAAGAVVTDAALALLGAALAAALAAVPGAAPGALSGAAPDSGAAGSA